MSLHHRVLDHKYCCSQNALIGSELTVLTSKISLYRVLTKKTSVAKFLKTRLASMSACVVTMRRGRGGFEDEDGKPAREDMGPSKADTSSSWGADRRQREPSPPRPSRGGGFGDSYTERDRKQAGGFADRYGEDRGSIADMGPSKADQEDRWSRKPVEPSAPRDSDRSSDRKSSFGAPRSDSEDRWSRRTASIPESDNSASLAAPTERRRLNLAARTAPPKELPPVAAPTPKPAEDEPTTAVPREQPDAPAQPPKPRSNPFGTARPREDVLKEQGRDWKREERALEHSRVKRCVLESPDIAHLTSG